MMRQLLGMLREAMARVGHQYSYQFQREWAQCGCLAIVFIAAGLGGCERQPFFRVPPKDTGGIALQCLGITDFGRRPQIGAGASNCAEFGSGIDYPLPEVSAEGNALGAVVFNDPLCTTTIASACVPKVIATTNEWEEPGLAPGHLHLERQLLRQENLLHPTLLGIDDSGSTNFDVKETVRRDARGVTTSGCFLAHFGFLSAKYVSSGVYRDPGGVWVAGVKFYEETYGHFTNVADSLAIGEFWGYSGGPSIPVENSYGNKVAGPAPYLCNEGETGGNGFGFRAVGVFSASGFESNPNSPVMERQSSCPEGDCELQPLNYDLALEPSSSMGTITISNGSESESADVGVKGSLQIQATECRRGANDVVSCDAKIVGSVLSVSAFELANTDVEFLTIGADSLSLRR